MKKLITFIVALLISCTYLFAQNKPINIVFDITSKDTVDHKNVLRWVRDISQEHPEANLEVVFYGKSLDMIIKDKSILTEGIENITKNPHVAFIVCEIALKNNNVEKSRLISGVVTVRDGILEIVSKQNAGWGYIKVSH